MKYGSCCPGKRPAGEPVQLQFHRGLPVCGGKGVIVTELAFMDPVITECEACGGVRYNEEALVCRYQGKNIVELLGLTASQAMEIFEDAKIRKHLKVMQQVGLSYLTLGQPAQYAVRRRAPENQAGKEPGKKRTYYCDGRADNRPAYV